MADFTALKTAIQTYIKQNGNEEITGEKLQEILLSMVTTLGDSAINALITALNDEVAARQNADGTLQQNITNEATARGNADTALGGRIDDEETARASGDTALSNRLGSTITAEDTAADQIGAEAEARTAADTALLELIDGITDNIENGYVYAGIATPSSTPATGKVFYLALTAGTYTNFGSTEVSQGINILKYNGSAWSLDAFIGIDDELTPGSNNIPKSGNVLENIIKNGSAFDLSAYNAVDGVPATYADLDAALAALNLLPAVYKQPGMSFRFVLTSDNKYVQFRLMADEWSTTESDWQGIDDEPTAGSDNLVKSGGVQNELDKKVDGRQDSKAFYVTDDNRNIIAKIDKDGVHSVDFKIGEEGDSVAKALGNIATQISNAVAEEENRAKEVESTKLDVVLNDNTFYLTDTNGYIICKIDAAGVHSVNIDEEPNKIDSDSISIEDSNGYIIARIDKDGIHCAKNKHAVACMVLSESYYPIATPTRDSDGNITYVEVMFETGIAGSLTITYTNGNPSSVAVVYGNYNYTITINRDTDGNVETVSVN